jgi:DNA-binding NarL/FixJ family response regulator
MDHLRVVEQERAGSRTLTSREHEVLRWLVTGLKAREIAQRISISRRTVERHLANAYLKLGVHSRLEAAEAFLGSAKLAS